MTMARCTDAGKDEVPPKLVTTEAAVVWAKFAAGAMAGLCSATTGGGEWAHGAPDQTARVAAEMADALYLEYAKRT